MAPARRLTLPQARRMALAAQGFSRPRPPRSVGTRDVTATIDRLAQFQIDSINVVERAHFLPLYSRFGRYDKALLERAYGTAPRRLVEYWGHAASLVDARLWPALRWRMAANAERPWARYLDVVAEHPHLPDWVLEEVAAKGPLTARQIEFDERRERPHWGWNWSSVKVVLEHLFAAGRVTSAGRTASFERLYDLPERVLPAGLATEEPWDRDRVILELVRRSARALGIGSLRCLADYFRLPQAPTLRAVQALVEAGELVPIRVEGWARDLWAWHDARAPRSIGARALVSPFDSVVFERRRTEELFGLRYRIEIYVPEPKRQYGYYVYPFLLGDRFAARVDLKADRASGELVVQSAWLEPRAAHEPGAVARELAAELGELGAWTGCGRVVVRPRGDLADDLASATRSDRAASGDTTYY